MIEHLVLGFAVSLLGVAWLLILRELASRRWPAIRPGEIGRERRNVLGLELRLRLLKRMALAIGRIEEKRDSARGVAGQAERG